MPTLFQKIIAREIPAEIIWEDADHIAFLDINPLQPGHLLVVPKIAAAYVFDMDDANYSALFLAAKKLTDPLQRATGAARIALIIEGLEVDHVHIHLVPINKPGDLDPKHIRSATADELKNIGDKIRFGL